MALAGGLAALNAVAHPPMSCAGRDSAGVPHYMHAARHAVDLVVGDGNLRNPETRARWIAFRRWVAGFEAGRFRLLGAPERSWDWPHVELADAPLGFRRWRSCCGPPGGKAAITLVA